MAFKLISFQPGVCIVDSKFDLKQNGRKYYIHRSDGQTLHKNEKHLELMAEKGEEDYWTEAFNEIGIYQDMSSSAMSFMSDKVHNYYQQSFCFC